MPSAVAELGREAFSQHAWRAAFDHFQAADRETQLEPDDLERLAVAAYLIAEDAASGDAWSRAHQALIDRGEIERAARCAFWQGFQLMIAGEMAPAAGWFERARRLLDDGRRDCVEAGYLLVPMGAQNIFAGKPETALEIFRQVADVARRFGDRDLFAFSGFGIGQALTALGNVPEGMASFDEVMAAITAGEISAPIAGLVYCGVIDACQELFDFRRAREWTAALTRWCDSQPDLVPYRGQCLVHRSQIMQMQGAWSDAIGEAERARDRLSHPPHPAVGMAYYQLGELHRLRGDVRRSEDAYRQAARYGRSPHPGLAQLWLSRGEPDTARNTIALALDEATSAVERSRLLPAYVEVLLAAGDITGAGGAADELGAIAAELGLPLLRAVATHARGAVLYAEGDAKGALGPLREAWTTWCDVDAPYEAARVRVLIGLAYRDLGDEPTAQMEFDAAIDAFEQLGATPDLERARSVRGPATDASGPLTPRERELLVLLATGKTNRAIAKELVISENTVARHVSNIFVKLGVSSRAAATAYAYEHKLV